MGLQRRTFTAMGCPCDILIECDDPVRAANGFDLAMAEVHRLDRKYSAWHGDHSPSHWQRVRHKSQQHSVAVDHETARLLDLADTAHRLSAGRFDISAGPLIELWDFRQGKIPSQRAIDLTRQHVGWERVQWDGKHLHCPQASMRLDLDGLVKEYAADAALGLLVQNGFARALVNLGGDIACHSESDGPAWPIAVSHPEHRDQPVSRLSLHRGGFASSGITQRCFVSEGRHFSHLINPISGWPVEGWLSISVVAEQSTLAGILATSALLMEHQAAEWLKPFDLPWLGIDCHHRLHGHLRTETAETTRQAAVTIVP